jgi:hypothetical protein
MNNILFIRSFNFKFIIDALRNETKSILGSDYDNIIESVIEILQDGNTIITYKKGQYSNYETPNFFLNYETGDERQKEDQFMIRIKFSDKPFVDGLLISCSDVECLIHTVISIGEKESTVTINIQKQDSCTYEITKDSVIIDKETDTAIHNETKKYRFGEQLYE